MNDTKRCSGHKGHWECDEEHPDHIVPISEFNKDKNGQYGVGSRCKKCHRYSISLDKHPITGKLKRNWKTDHAKSLGGVRNTPDWQSYLDKAAVVWDQDVKSHLLNTAPAEEVLAHIEKRVFPKLRDKKPKFNEGLPAAKPARKRTNLEPLDKLPPEGWVYIIAASRHASIMKIGSTFEYGIRDRLSEAKRWALAGSAVLLHKEWFSRCKQAESLVHKRLDYYRIVSPDAGDELFRTSFEHALANVMIIKNEVENDRKEQAMG